MKKQNVRTLSLIVCTFTYLLIGAALFDAIESEEEEHQLEALQVLESHMFNKYNITQRDFDLMEEVVYLMKPYKAGKPWQFAGSFYYATTVLTTIGYGHSTPKTREGKMFTLLYAGIGIPLGLVMFNSIGERLNKFFSMIITRLRRSVKASQQETTEVDLIMVVLVLSGAILVSGASCFSFYENWSFFDATYYCFVTLTTIGFGDLVALQNDKALEKDPEYVTFALLFIMFGLAVISAGLNLMVLKFMTLNTEDEKRDEIEAMQAARMTVRLDGDVIIGDMITNRRFQSEGMGSIEDMRSVCSCTCLTCHQGIFSRRASRPGSSSPPVPYSDYYMSPPRSRHCSIHDLRRTSSSDCALVCLDSPQSGGHYTSTNIITNTADTSLNVSRADVSFISSPARPNTSSRQSYHFVDTLPVPDYREEGTRKGKKEDRKRTSV